MNDSLIELFETYVSSLSAYNQFVIATNTRKAAYKIDGDSIMQAAIAAAGSANTLCIAAITAIQNEQYNVDGGLPNTSFYDPEYDCNGGYPV